MTAVGPSISLVTIIITLLSQFGMGAVPVALVAGVGIVFFALIPSGGPGT